MKQKKKYEGVLSEPMALDGGPGQLFERLSALTDYYGIERVEKGGALALALRLARDHVPGFRYKNDRPSSKERKEAAKDFIIFMELIKADASRKSVSRAAGILANKHPEWGLRGESIRQRYQDMKHRKGVRGANRVARAKELIELLLPE
jgi:hypothetical protein